MSKTEKVLKVFRAEGFSAAQRKAEELGLGFYPSQFEGHFELWAVRNSKWIKQLAAV